MLSTLLLAQMLFAATTQEAPNPQSNAGVSTPSQSLSVALEGFAAADRQRFTRTGSEILRAAAVTSLRLDYSLSGKDGLFLYVPYILQHEQLITSGGAVFDAFGNGFGDARFGLIHRVTAGPWTNTLELGLKPTTGTSDVASGALPTGTGTTEWWTSYVGERQIIPIRIAVGGSYGSTVTRTFMSQTYGAQAGVVFAISPEFSFQSGINFSQLNSPILYLTEQARTAYLTSSLAYRNERTFGIILSFGAGLTNDSFKFNGSMSIQKTFR